MIGDDEITEEEYQDMVSYIQNKNRNNLNKKWTQYKFMRTSILNSYDI